MDTWQVDGADRWLAGVYVAVAALFSLAAAALSDPRALGPCPSLPIFVAGLLCAALAISSALPRPDVPRPPTVMVYAAAVRATACLASTTWVGWGAQFGIHHKSYWIWGVCAVSVIGTAAVKFAMPTNFGGPARLTGPDGLPVPPHEWALRIERVAGMKGVNNVVVTHWAGSTGYDVDGDFGDGGDTYQDLQRFESAFASDLRLPPGCGVTVKPGRDRGAFKLQVSTVDVMAEARAYPR